MRDFCFSFAWMERARALHEDIERLEVLAAEHLLKDSKSVSFVFAVVVFVRVIQNLLLGLFFFFLTFLHSN